MLTLKKIKKNSCEQEVLLITSFLLMSTTLKQLFWATLETVTKDLSTVARQQKYNLSSHLYKVVYISL